MINNRTGLLFGPAGATAGVVILIAGLSIFNTWVGLIMILASVFFMVTFTGTIIDLKKNKVQQYTALFGLFKVGDKESLKGFTAMVVLPDKEKYHIYSQSNRSMESSSGKFIVALIDDSSYRQILVGKYKTMELAKSKLKEYSQLLSIPIHENDNND